MTLVKVLAFVSLFSTGACGSAFTSPSAVQVSIKDVHANRSAYVGQLIEVSGRIEAVRRDTLEACPPACGESEATLHIVVPGEQRNDANSFDLYEQAAAGAYVPLKCRISASGAFDCGAFTRDATTTIRGTFTRDRKAVQSVGGSGGATVITYVDVYFLVVRR